MIELDRLTIITVSIGVIFLQAEQFWEEVNMLIAKISFNCLLSIVKGGFHSPESLISMGIGLQISPMNSPVSEK